jgi:hypothetical protein
MEKYSDILSHIFLAAELVSNTIYKITFNSLQHTYKIQSVIYRNKTPFKHSDFVWRVEILGTYMYSIQDL